MQRARANGRYAGACAAYLTIKPQLFFLLFLAIAVWMLTRRRPVPFFGGLAVLVMATGIALIANPEVVVDYVTALTAYPPVAWATPTIGGIRGTCWVPSISGPQFLAHSWNPMVDPPWHRNRERWNWAGEVLSCFWWYLSLTTAYIWKRMIWSRWSCLPFIWAPCWHGHYEVGNCGAFRCLLRPEWQ